jgi:hypothetical protein
VLYCQLCSTTLFVAYVKWLPPADADELPGQEQATQPAITSLKPATLESLGTGAAAERQRTAAIAAAQAASVPPRQLASAVQGACMTVTGSSGQRVYCQLDTARPKGEGGAPPAAAAAGGSAVGRGVLRGCGLLAQPIEVLLDQLAEKRRQVGGLQAAQQLEVDRASWFAAGGVQR